MATISTEQDVVTLVNVFTVAPEDQQRLVDLLVEATETTMNMVPGYISANIHRSLDGTRVVNYAQWRSRMDFEAMLNNPEAAPHMREAAQIAERFEPHLYEVSFVDEAADEAEGRPG
ncbi:MAG TPA: antibiotic biosynthesis monooxygenase family protein [Rubrobacter sp.]|jgi:quinol monooxygenase YgiN|nr:antibiotic biosynthesis monooxygenase family protein [Rubrobacter sp.]